MEPGHLKALTEADEEAILPFLLCKYYGWSLDEVERLSLAQFNAALAVMGGFSAAQNEG